MKLAAVLALLVLVLAPFAKKPFHTDDPLFVWHGTSMAEAPLEPCRLSVNWFGATQPISEVMRNPPGLQCFVAALHRVGWLGESALHWWLFVPALCLALAVHRWASSRKDCNPELAALLAIASPAFLVSATNVLPDVAMAACVTSALFLWMRGIDRDRTRDLVSASIACALGCLTKYFAVSLIPFLAWYALRGNVRAARWLPLLSMSALPLAAYEAWMWKQSGSPPFVAGFRALGGDVRGDGGSAFARIVLTIVFFGGACLPSCGIAALRALRSARGVVACTGFAALAAWFLSGSIGPATAQRGIVSAELFVLALAGACVLVELARRWTRSVHGADRWMIAWIAWELSYAAFLNWSVTERGLVTSASLFAILAASSVRESRLLPGVRALIAGVPLILALLVGVTLNRADRDIAESGERAAADLVAPFVRDGKTVWFQGHWGFQYYAEASGAKPMEPSVGQRGKAGDDSRTLVARGDVVVIPMLNTNIAGVPRDEYTLLETRAYPIAAWITTLGPMSAAGFYSSALGCLPFGANLGDECAYWVFERR
jgi:hypothetical protein